MDHVLEAISIRRKVTSAEEVQGNLNRLIRRFVTANLYRDPPAVLKELSRQIFRQAQAEYLPYARKVASLAVKPILDKLKGADLTKEQLALRGRYLQGMRGYTQRNMLVLRAEIQQQVGQLKGEIDAMFARGFRDRQARKSIIDAAVQADKAEQAQLALVRADQEAAQARLAEAEKHLATARNKKKAATAVKQAKAEVKKHARRLRSVKTMAGRFETRLQGNIRDGIRREAEHAQQQAFAQAGYESFAWIAVNGDDACPYCTEMHGTVHTAAEWRGKGPGESPEQAEYCGAACMCILIPDDYKKQSDTLDKPLHKDWVK